MLFMGRKKKKPADRRTEYVKVMFTAAEKLEVERSAGGVGMDVGTMVRTYILEVIRKKKQP